MGLERDDQGAPARPAGRLPRAVDALHPLRRADARAAATATGATRRSGPSTRRRWTSCSTPTRTACRACWPGPRSASRARDGEPEAAHLRSIKAKALDLLRGLLPAASLSHMGIFATGQAYEQLLLRLLASPLPEARDYGRHDPARAEGR